MAKKIEAIDEIDVMEIKEPERAVIYARKSTEKFGQKETLENQIKICRRKAKDFGIEVVDIKTDTATGTDDNNRPEVKELIADAIKGKYNVVIMKGISRLYRDVEHGLALVKKLNRHDIRVITVEEGFDSFEKRGENGQIDTSRITMYLMFAEMESKKLADRIKHTQIEKAYAGEWNQVSSTPMGYNYNKTTKKLEIDNSKSHIIQKIFKLYLDGEGMRQICLHLNGENEEGIIYSPPRAKRWTVSTISSMLKNPVFAGDVVYNRKSAKLRPYINPKFNGKTEDDLTRKSVINAKNRWIVVPNAHEPIIERDLFDKVQSMIELKGNTKGVKKTTSLLASLIKCGKCGQSFALKRGTRYKDLSRISRSSYYCIDYLHFGTKYCTNHHIYTDELEDFVMTDLQNEIDLRLNIKDATSNLKAKKENSNNSAEKKIKRLEKDIEVVSRNMKKLFEKNMSGAIGDNQFEIMNKAYTEELDQFVNQLEKLKVAHDDTLSNESANDYLKKKYDEVKDIKNLPREKQRYLLLDLVKQISFNDGEIEIQYKF